MKLAEERDMREMKAAAHHWHGEALMLSGELDAAQAELQTAAEIADQVGRLRLIWDVQAALARCSHLRGDTERAAQHEAAVREIVGRIAANLTSDDLRLGLPEVFPTP
jgi:hypothetical protein